MSAECSKCGSDISYPEGTWPVGTCLRCDLAAERDEWKQLCLDMGEWMRRVWEPEEHRHIVSAIDGEMKGTCQRCEKDALLARLNDVAGQNEKEQPDG